MALGAPNSTPGTNGAIEKMLFGSSQQPTAGGWKAAAQAEGGEIQTILKE